MALNEFSLFEMNLINEWLTKIKNEAVDYWKECVTIGLAVIEYADNRLLGLEQIPHKEAHDLTKAIHTLLVNRKEVHRAQAEAARASLPRSLSTPGTTALRLYYMAIAHLACLALDPIDKVKHQAELTDLLADARQSLSLAAEEIGLDKGNTLHTEEVWQADFLESYYTARKRAGDFKTNIGKRRRISPLAQIDNQDWGLDID